MFIHKYKGQVMLTLTAMIWGTAFLIMKDAIEALPAAPLLFIRFIGATALLVLIFHKKLKLINKKLTLHGSIIGILEAAGYLIQTYGLYYTSPGKSAFLTAIYCVLVPFFSWILFRQNPQISNWIAAALCLFGIGLISLSDSLFIGPGESLTVLCSVFFALQVIAVSYYSQTDDVIALTIIMFITMTIFFLPFSISSFSTLATLNITPALVLQMIYLIVICTTLALILQNLGQALVPSSQSAILMSLQSVFGALFSVIFRYEDATFRLVLGFVLVFIAVLVSEIGIGFIKKLKFTTRFEK